MPEHQTISSPAATIAAAANQQLPMQENLQEPGKEYLNGLSIQRKLAIGAADDPLEQEADTMADTIMLMPEQNFVQRQCSHCEEEEQLQRKCNECEEEEKKLQRKPLASFVQRKASSQGAVASDTISDQVNASRGNGDNIDNSTQTFMQNRFGADFSNVKIHTGSEAVQMNRDLNAKAFTVGNDIYFNEGQYNTGSYDGKHLLAHELTHTVQQGNFLRTKKIQKKENGEEATAEKVNVIKKPKSKNPVKNGALSFQYSADQPLPRAQVNVPNHPLMIWAVQKVFNINEEQAVGVVSTALLQWTAVSSRTKDFAVGDLVVFTLPVSVVGEWIGILADNGIVDPNSATLFKQMMELQQSLSDRDYSFFLEWAKSKGTVTTNITDFKNLTPESLAKLKALYAEFNANKYSIIPNSRNYFLTEDVTRDMRFEELKDSLFNKKLEDLSAEERARVLDVFKDKALSFAFQALEETKLISKRELKKYKDNNAQLDEVANIIYGFSPEFLKSIEERVIVFNKFHQVLYSMISVDPQKIGGPLNYSAYWTMFPFAARYSPGTNIADMLNNDANKNEVISAFSPKNFDKELVEALAIALSPYSQISDQYLEYNHYPAGFNNTLFQKYRQRLPVNKNGHGGDEVRAVCLQIIYEEYPVLLSANVNDAAALNDMRDKAKSHDILKDISIDFRELALQGRAKIKETIISTLEEKPVKAEKTQSRLAEDTSLLWEFQPMLYYLLQKENIDQSHPIYKIVEAKINSVADKSFWQSLALGALGLVLGIAGLVTGGVTTVLGVALLSGAAVVSIIDFASEYSNYTIQSDAHNSALTVPFADDPSSIGVIFSLLGLVLDVGDVLKVFGKGAKVAAVAGEAASDAAKASDAAIAALGKTKNMEEYSNQLFEILNGKKMLKAGVTKEIFIKTLKENWEQSSELISGWRRYSGIIEQLPEEVKALIKSDGFMAIPVEMRSSFFKIYDYSREALIKTVKSLSGAIDKLKLLAFQVFKKKVLAEVYGQLSQVLNPAHYEKVLQYFAGIGYHSSEILPELLHIMNRGDIFSKGDLALQVLTNRKLQQLTLNLTGQPETLLKLWEDFAAHSGEYGGDFAKYMEKNAAYAESMKLAESSSPVAKIAGAETNKGVLTDMHGRPPKPTAFAGLDADMEKLGKSVDNPHNISEVSDPFYKPGYDAEVTTDGHTFRRNKETGKWCRFSDEVCNLETPAGINSKVDEALGNPGNVKAGSAEDITTKIEPAEIPEVQPKPGEAGSPEHRAERWKQYQDRTTPGERWSKERWDKQYDVNMKQASKANEAVKAYHAQIGWGTREVTVDVEGEVRRLDIADKATSKGIEYKTGEIYASQSILWEVARDEILVNDMGWKITWVFRDYASRPLIDALKKAKIEVIVKAVVQ